MKEVTETKQDAKNRKQNSRLRPNHTSNYIACQKKKLRYFN